MKAINLQLKIKKKNDADYIEREISYYGKPLRWAIVEVSNEHYTIDCAILKEDE
ncbi:MAG: hypothetical protein PHX18_00690 [Candidatus Gastranaerophilales bacterium]|nr:hypothetical protein [Candidatus Gastranaerophilales bacterium]